MKKKLVITAVVAAAALGVVPAAAGAAGKSDSAPGKQAQACAASFGYSTVGQVARAGVEVHGNVAGGVPAALAAHCSG
jgi:hypothetical protein